MSHVYILFDFFLGRLLVLYFSLVAPAICYLFFLHVVLYVFLANK